MTPATAELQRRSFEIAMQATERALAKPPEACRTCGSPRPHLHPAVQHEGEVHICRDPFHAMPWPPDEEQPRDPELPPEDPDDLPFSCLTCEDTGEIEVQQRNSAGQAYREPWATQTIACPDCNQDGAR